MYSFFLVVQRACSIYSHAINKFLNVEGKNIPLGGESISAAWCIMHIGDMSGGEVVKVVEGNNVLEELHTDLHGMASTVATTIHRL